MYLRGRSLRVFIASDFHGNIKAVQNVISRVEELHTDVVIISGDITHFGSLQEAKEVLSLFGRLRLPILFVPGNCDPHSLIGVDIEGARCIHGTYELYGDFMFIGVGGSIKSPFHSPFELTENEVMKVLKKSFNQSLTNYRCVLVSHNPPKNTKVDTTYAGDHIGSLSIRQFIEEIKPSIVFCGHVHESRGIDQIGDTIVVNPGPARHGCYAIADFNRKIEVKLHWL